ncbi:hypothetical protein CRG98_004248 [Punica granatum]|uniref:Flavin-containing monooxygenase n=1 Tax=Punica granatum TaxID=22663 RepID=A0A2I0L3V5_PUNGR|nr:hypothetical protein CRG98_004248 [Punica granatum]
MAREQSRYGVISSRVAIIGAGVSGLAAAKQLSHLNPIVFEATDSIGGVWRHYSYESTRLQSLRCDYEFSDFPWLDRDNSSFPSHTEIIDYLTAYAKNFNLLKNIKFNSKVMEIRFVGDGKPTDNLAEFGNLLPGKPVWEIAVQTDSSGTIQWYSFEFVVTCIGKYGDIPKIPAFPCNKGPEVFEGKVLHTTDYSKLDKEATTELLKEKKVVVIGFKKSAIDLALECAEANKGKTKPPI